MFLVIIFGLTVGILVLMSGWIRFGLLFVTNGFIGNNIPWLYLFLGFYIGKGVSQLLTSTEYWIFFISSFLSTLFVQIFSAWHDSRISGIHSTVTTSASLLLVSSFLGMIYRLIFL